MELFITIMEKSFILKGEEPRWVTEVRRDSLKKAYRDYETNRDDETFTEREECGNSQDHSE